MRVPIAVYSGARTLAPWACSAAIATRTGPHAFFMFSRYFSGRSSRFSLSTARLMTWKFTSMSRTFSTSRIQRDVIHAHGHSGSNQKSATDFLGMGILSSAVRLTVQHNRSRGRPVPGSGLSRRPAAPSATALAIAAGLSRRPAAPSATALAIAAGLSRRPAAPSATALAIAAGLSRRPAAPSATALAIAAEVGPVALPNLTRDQAVERASLITVGGYRINLDLTDGNGAPGDRTFRSTTTVEFVALAGADTFIDIAAEKIHNATLNGRDLDVSAYDESTGIALTGLAEHNVVVVDADCRYTNTGEGLHRFVDPVDDEVYLYSQFETADAKRMFACFDQPDLKATFDITVTAPEHWQVISNGASFSSEGGVHTFATTQ